MSAESLEPFVRLGHVDHLASRVVLRDGAEVALALIARRGRRSRIAALGVVAEARKTGLGAALLARVVAESNERGDEAIVLECFAHNEPALSLYRRAGFQTRRRLVSYRSTPSVALEGPFEEVDPAELGRVMARYEAPQLPWQIAPETLAAFTAPMRCFTSRGSAFACIGAVGDAEASLPAVFTLPHLRRKGHAARLIRAIAASLSPRALSVPPIVPQGLADAFFQRIGFSLGELAQHEMELALG